MGGTRNQEEKKKQNNVFTSGSGGGTRGPATLDKRNQEMQCPHCERVFKQIQRFREHVAKQHANAAEPAAEEACQPVAVQEQTFFPPAMRMPMQASLQHNLGAMSLSTCADRAGNGCGKQRWSMDTKVSKATAAGMDTEPEEGKASVQDPASGRKQLQMQAQVVLPDLKDNDKDQVVFLDASQAAENEEDAQQAGALAALYHVAGDRAMQRILPQQYLPAWEWHGQQAQNRRQQAAAREAAAEARKERDKARRAAEARRKPSRVIMSDSQQRMVEAVLDDLRIDIIESRTSSGSGSCIVAEAAVTQLERLGFTSKDARSAVDATKDGQGVALSAALDWLCLNVPEEHLPAAFAAGSSGKPVEVIRPQGKFDSNRLGSANDATYLASYGYRSEEVSAALQACQGDEEAAYLQLYSRLTGSNLDTRLADKLSEEWIEEQQALIAIYGTDAQIMSPRHTRLQLDDGRMTLDLRLATSTRYPDSPPLIGIRSAVVPSWALLQLTRQLAAEATQKLIGNPMGHDLALAAPELLNGILASPPCTHELQAPAWRQNSTGQPHQQQQSSLTVATDNSIDTSDAPEQKSLSRRRDRHSRLDATAESDRLYSEAAKEPSLKLRSLQEARRKLPAFGRRAELLVALQAHHVLVISGATGCGKSTQVPQFILEDAISRRQGGSCNIICTQPRRISAVGLGQRVSQERGESVGQVVGYAVRFDSRTSAHTRLLFCTTGILLRRLLSDPDLHGTTHIIVDEVHERSVDSDLLLHLLRSLLQRREGLKVILMSATADAGLYTCYFAASPSKGTRKACQLTIPGFTHPVRDFYLEDALEFCKYSVGKSSRWAKRAPTGGSQPTVNGAKRHERSVAAHESAAHEKWVTPQDYSEQTLRSLAIIDESLVNYDLLEALICYIVSPEGLQSLSQAPVSHSDVPSPVVSTAQAILVFMPGAPEISRLVRLLQNSATLQRAASGQQLQVLPLHGALPPPQQAKVFEHTGAGVRKIVVATNVAETSITIDDVVSVIDTGRFKEMRYDVARGLSRLEETWVSKAAAAQRRGRAGRVQPGVCFKLFSRKTAARLQEHQPPEVLRVPLQQLCLTVKATVPGSPPVGATLAGLLTPPDPSTIAAAVDDLTKMGALTQDEAITPLGKHLSQMPMDAKLGKALIYGAMLRCLEPVLTIVAAMGYGRPVFLAPPDQREEANAAKMQLTAASTAAKSDHLALVSAFNTWNRARLSGGRHEAAQVSSRYFLSEAAMEGVLAGRTDYAAALADLGFISQGYLRNLNTSQASTSPGSLDEFSDNARIVKAAVCAGFYPSILRVEHPAAQYVQTLGGALEKDAAPVKLRFYDRVKGRVFMHPASVNFNVGRYESPWLVYTDLTETSKVFCREASMAPVYSLLLFGGEITVDHEKSLMKLDGWATFKTPARIAVLVKELRAEVERLLLQKLQDPSLDLSQSKAVGALHRLLATDGF